MSFTVAEVLADVRDLVQDNSTPYRYDDADLVRKFNQVLRRAVILRPDLFTQVSTLTCIAGSMQLCPADSVRLMDVLSNANGGAVKQVNQEVIDLMIPDWETLTPGPTTNWMRYPRDPNRFYVYPAATAGLALQIIYSKCPALLILTDTVPMQDVYMPVLVDGVCWSVEAIDAEHVESGRAKMFKDSFTEALTTGLQARRITDTDSAAGPAEETV
jgi:hypothetical protein